MSKKNHAPNGDGSIWKDSNGVRHFKVRMGKRPDGSDYRPVIHQRKNESLNSFMERVEQKRREARRSLRILATDRIISDYFLNEWLEFGMQSITDTYRGQILSCFHNHIEPVFGNKRLDDLRAPEVRRCYSLLSMRGVSNDMIGRVHKYMNQMFRYAIGDDVVDYNPFEYVKKPKHRRKEQDFLTKKEIRRFLYANRDHPMRRFFHLALFFGARPHEILSLKLNDIHLNRKVPWVRIRGTKTRNADRIIAVTPAQASVIRQEIIVNKPVNYLFETDRGTRHDSANLLKRVIRPALAVAGIDKNVTFHGFRHSNATLKRSLGVSEKVSNETLGHGSTRSASPYLHVDIEAQYEELAVVHEFEQEILADIQPISIEDVSNVG